MRKQTKKIWNIVSGVLVGAVVLLALAIAGPRLVGYQSYAVLSGSMEPTYPVGALLYVQPCDASKVAVGDPITFVMNENLLVATHRVVRIDEANQRFFTKGDANNAEDGAPVHFQNLIGKPVFSIPKLGYLSAFVETPQGKIIGITLVVLLLLLAFLPDILSKSQKKDGKGAEETPNEKPYLRKDSFGRAGRLTDPKVQLSANEEEQS